MSTRLAPASAMVATLPAPVSGSRTSVGVVVGVSTVAGGSAVSVVGGAGVVACVVTVGGVSSRGTLVDVAGGRLLPVDSADVVVVTGTVELVVVVGAGCVVEVVVVVGVPHLRIVSAVDNVSPCDG